MKKHSFLVVLLVFAISGLLLTSCFRFSFSGKNTSFSNSGFTYSNSKKYTAGNGSVPASRVKDIEISWVDGSINLTEGSGSSVTFQEEIKGNAKEEQLLHWYLDGSTLRLMYQKSGIVTGESITKNLVVTLPRGMGLDDLDINYVSSNVVVGVDSESYEMDGVSGDLTIKSHGAKKVKINTVSGNSYLEFSSCPSDLSADSVSGSFELVIPSDSSFKADLDTLSGNISCSIPTTRDGDELKAGSGKAELEFDTVSGNVTIRSK